MESKFISLIVYLYDDISLVEMFLDNICNTISNFFLNYEIIFVDDGCSDAMTARLKISVKEHGMEGMVSILHMGFHQGIEASMNAGRDVAIGDFVFEFDSMIVDYAPRLIVSVYEHELEGYDVVAASNGISRSKSSSLFYRVFNRHSNSETNIGTETFRLISRRAINRVKSMGTYIPYRKAVYANCGLKSDTINYKSLMDEKNYKEVSGYNHEINERGSLALDSFIYFTNVMEKISTVISTVFLLVSIITVVYTIADYFIEKTLVEGWTSLMCFISIGFFGVFLLLTIILKYLSVVLELIFKKQKYLVTDIEKIK